MKNSACRPVKKRLLRKGGRLPRPQSSAGRTQSNTVGITDDIFGQTLRPVHGEYGVPARAQRSGSRGEEEGQSSGVQFSAQAENGTEWISPRRGSERTDRGTSAKQIDTSGDSQGRRSPLEHAFASFRVREKKAPPGRAKTNESRKPPPPRRGGTKFVPMTWKSGTEAPPLLYIMSNQPIFQ